MKPTEPQTKLSRRSFLKVSGAALLLLSGGGLYRAVDQGVFSTSKGPAYEPWAIHAVNQADLSDKAPERLVHYAILASNAHNTQPWLFRVHADRIELYADLSKNIGTMDPYFREMNISLGCAIENLCLAAQAHGFEPNVKLLDGDIDQAKVATIDLSPSSPHSSPLFHMITKRHTHRGAYDSNKPVSVALLNEMSTLSDHASSAKLLLHTDQQMKEQLGSLIVQATEAIVHDADQARDSHRWYRHSQDDIHRFKDGTTLDATGNSTLVRVFGKMLSISEKSSNEYWLKSTKEVHIPTASAYGSIVLAARSKAQLLEAGRLWQRIHLWATSKGIALHPLNQVNERLDREQQMNLTPHFGDALRSIVGGHGEHVFLFRMGYARDQALPSPRRSADEVQLQ